MNDEFHIETFEPGQNTKAGARGPSRMVSFYPGLSVRLRRSVETTEGRLPSGAKGVVCGVDRQNRPQVRFADFGASFVSIDEDDLDALG